MVIVRFLVFEEAREEYSSIRFSSLKHETVGEVAGLN